jgi:hypothetical protein
MDWSSNSKNAPDVALPDDENWNANFIWPSALVLGGLFCTFGWITLLSWGLWNLIFSRLVF